MKALYSLKKLGSHYLVTQYHASDEWYPQHGEYPTFEVITAVLLRIQVFRDVVPYYTNGSQHV